MNWEQKTNLIKSGSYIIVCNDAKTIDLVVNQLVEKYNISKGSVTKISDDKKTIKIDQIRKAKKKIIFKSIDSYNILAINNAQFLTRESANSLLKVVEEPPRMLIVLIFVDNVSRLLPTIISRCKKIVLRNKLELTSDNRYINLLKKILSLREIHQKFAIIDSIVKSDIDIAEMLTYWMVYLEENINNEDMLYIQRIDQYAKKYSKSLNKKLFLESLVLGL